MIVDDPLDRAERCGAGLSAIGGGMFAARPDRGLRCSLARMLPTVSTADSPERLPAPRSSAAERRCIAASTTAIEPAACGMEPRNSLAVDGDGLLSAADNSGRARCRPCQTAGNMLRERDVDRWQQLR